MRNPSKIAVPLMLVVMALPLAAADKTGSSDTSQKTGSEKSKAGMPETSFVKEAAQGGMAEVELGQLAVKRAKSEDVKQFGQRMVDDHSKANEELKQLAGSKGWTVPTEIGSKHRATITKLTNASDANFDREYMHEMVLDHDHDVKAFQRYSSSGTDPELKAWVDKTLPTLQEHQQMAKSTASKVGDGKMSRTGTKQVPHSTTSSDHSTEGRKMPGETGEDTSAGTTTPRH